jgi:hypothetical protein
MEHGAWSMEKAISNRQQGTGSSDFTADYTEIIQRYTLGLNTKL